MYSRCRSRAGLRIRATVGLAVNGRIHCRMEGLIQVTKNIVDVLDAHAEAHRFRRDSSFALLFGRHLPHTMRINDPASSGLTGGTGAFHIPFYVK